MAEIRTTSSTGGQKGVKPERHSLLPKQGLDAIARVFGFGASKYEAHNWRRGYEWEKSFDALIRHVLAANDGETYDPESGEPHLAHAGFHVLVMLTWLAEQGEGADNPFDTRWPAGVERARREALESLLEDVYTDSGKEAFELPDLRDRVLVDEGEPEPVIWAAPEDPEDCRQALLQATQRLRDAYAWLDEHPEDAHGADEVEYAQDMVDQAVKDYETLGPDAAVPARTLGEDWGEAGWVDETQWVALKPIQDHVNRMVAALFDAQQISEAFAPGDGASIPGAVYWNDPAPVNLANVEDAFEALSKTDFAQTLSTTFDVNLSPAAHRILFGIPDSDPRHFVVDTLGEASETLPAHGYVGEYRDMLRKHAPQI